MIVQKLVCITFNRIRTFWLFSIMETDSELASSLHHLKKEDVKG
jgi:hypothetical protein